ncbi:MULTISPECIES: ABC-type transport auxiliary lipoprotein family protein [Ramlibacter]|uniref:Membrane integrity-associated transporter subunit PqiC n=1 Tax=Ramlibacter aquaticus TaxID=2780094 RepID=A0ABR9SH17_9BURK|nr:MULTISPECIES: ABC-type transport auxiliary lipoprotein family protein [Ramlibacter]MBE7941650.1 membrane integrity-associated transporter subunit PqiC [Ramlibacter aquaticus]
MKPHAVLAALALVLVAGCATPDKPVRPSLYDFGPGAAAPQAAVGQAAPVLLADIDVPGSLEGAALLYRLGYADDHQLHPYALARWSAPPGQLVRHRLREVLGRDRPVLDPSEGAAVARVRGSAPRVLRLDLEEFSQVFDSPSASVGLMRLRATLLDNTAAGERLLAQRSFVVRQPAPSADASGGVRALAAATDQAAEDLRQWLAQQP